ncbi:MAG: M6 family metalloprotease domain-containing protein [Bacillota bacterium]
MVYGGGKKKLSLLAALLMVFQLLIFAEPGIAAEDAGNMASHKQYMPIRPDLQKQGGLSGGTGMKGSGKAQAVVNPKLPDGSIKPNMSPAPVLNRSGKLLTPQVGIKKSVAIMVYFADEPFSPGFDQAYFDRLLFDDAPGANSLTNYYKEQSYGKIDIEGIVLGPYKSDHLIEHYAKDKDTDNNQIDDFYGPIDELTRESVRKAVYHNPGFKWSDYDRDSDGFIDNVIIIQAGPGQEEVPPNLYDQSIWSHYSSLPDGGEEPVDPLGTLKVKNYTMQPAAGKVGVFAHEYGHALGLPDLYDVTNQISGAGDWELMASGAWNGPLDNEGATPAGLSAWSKHYLGWLNYTEPAADLKDVVLRNTADHPEALRLWTDGQASGTYYLVENRQKKGYDSFLPGEGLLVWWVDNPDRFIADNLVNIPVPSCMPVEADGKYNLWSFLPPDSNRGDAGDPFPGLTGNTAFTFTSKPNATTYDPNTSRWEAAGLWDGLYTGVSLWNIHALDSSADIKTYRFDATVKNGLLLTPRTGVSKTAIMPGESTDLEYVLLNDNTLVSIKVLDDNGNVLRHLLANQKENKGLHRVSWDGKSSNGSYLLPGNYRINIETSVTNPSTNTNDPMGEGYGADVTATASHVLNVQVTGGSSSGGGGGGGGGGGTAADSDKTNIAESKFNDAIAASKEKGRVEITAPDKEVQLNEAQLEKIAQTENPVSVSVNNVGIVISNQLVERLAAIGNTRFTAEVVAGSEAQRVAAGAVNSSQYKLVDTVYDISIKANNQDFLFKGGETAIVQLPVSAQAKALALKGNLTVGYYNPAENKWEDLKATYDEKKNAMVFAASHFSMYAVLEKTAQADVMKKPVVILLNLNNAEAQINNYKYSLDARPYLDHTTARTMVPVRFISEALGCKVDWDEAGKRVEISKGNNLLVLTLGSKEVLVNGKRLVMDCAPVTLPPGRTFVPLRFISETLGASVDYEKAAQTIKIAQ